MRIRALLATLSIISLGGAFVVAAPAITTKAAAQTAAATNTDVSAQRGERGERGERRENAKPHRAAPRPPARAPNTVVRPGHGGNVVVRPGGGRNVVVRPGGGARVIAGRHGPRVGVRIVGGGPIRLGGRNVTIIRGPRFVTWRGVRRSLVPIAVLSALTVGGVAYAAYGYVPVAQNLCDGYTEDGCQFMWTDVPTAEGDIVPQCVTYCPAQ